MEISHVVNQKDGSDYALKCSHRPFIRGEHREKYENAGSPCPQCEPEKWHEVEKELK